MRVSSKTDYALRTVLDLALHHGEGVIKAAEIAQRQQIPLKFLEQILLALRGGGIVESRRGARGGYLLAKEAGSICLTDVVKLTEDALLSVSSSRRGAARRSTAVDPFEGVWKRIDHSIVSVLSGLTFADVCKEIRERSRRAAHNYTI
ncbi:MAG: Rrf2 family transcriptional regulator [Lysobacterales bacterium]|nr:MAG: Rrf2 family transcriptional regulator [Xanthomonadales bacterium]